MDWQSITVHIVFYLSICILLFRGIRALLKKNSRGGCPGCDGSCETKDDHGNS